MGSVSSRQLLRLMSILKSMAELFVGFPNPTHISNFVIHYRKLLALVVTANRTWDVQVWMRKVQVQMTHYRISSTSMKVYFCLDCYLWRLSQFKLRFEWGIIRYLKIFRCRSRALLHLNIQLPWYYSMVCIWWCGHACEHQSGKNGYDIVVHIYINYNQKQSRWDSDIRKYFN